MSTASWLMCNGSVLLESSIALYLCCFCVAHRNRLLIFKAENRDFRVTAKVIPHYCIDKTFQFDM